ncbi:hypothetical protein [Micromonospora carbonacea]|uniref:YCII-related domain-containing protein n=1 Tax=Micromonospora carbonacea TaxID=47853 RepID=A0A1C4YLU0_9ACTN|nr:hypothetical protein [Micromonospora carbonacea]SCF21699.1 YCII-related domain-containing protein [Micromonospora carbonacea]
MERRQQFVGYLTVDCESIERAVEIAAGWPDVVRGSGVLEVRPTMDEAGAKM